MLRGSWFRLLWKTDSELICHPVVTNGRQLHQVVNTVPGRGGWDTDGEPHRNGTDAPRHTYEKPGGTVTVGEGGAGRPGSVRCLPILTDTVQTQTEQEADATQEGERPSWLPGGQGPVNIRDQK